MEDSYMCIHLDTKRENLVRCQEGSSIPASKCELWNREIQRLMLEDSLEVIIFSQPSIKIKLNDHKESASL